MFYRVDYILAVMFTGFVVGALFSRPSAEMHSSRVACGYYIVVLALLILRAVTFTGTMLTSQTQGWGTASGFLGDVLGVLFGALFGLSARRRDARELLTSPLIFDSLIITLAFTFAIAGIGKAFSVGPMTEFFAQSGYSVPFLKFIVIAEIFGGIGLLLPRAVLPALIGLAVDMFGAVLTHIHNGDPLNDSTGAIGLLIRLVAVGILFALRHRNGVELPSVRGSALQVAAATIVCLVIAMGGSVAVRHLTSTPGIASQSSK